MKSLRLMLCAMPLMLTGCSTMSSVNWSAANPWNWFGSSTKVSEQGVGELTASTPLQEQAIADALDGDYRLRSGMKTANGNVVRFFEVMKGDNVAMVIKARSAALMCWIAIFLLTPVLKSVHRLVTFTAKHLAIAKRPTVMIIVPSNVKPKAVNILATSSAGNGVVLKG
mgnify:CR=1 FL=1